MKKNKTFKYILSCAVGAALILSCSKDDDKDMTPPTISDQGIVASPVNCQVYHPGDVIYFNYLLQDDTELGSFNIEVHGNFDHHSHSTEGNDHDHEGGECQHEENHEHEPEEAEKSTPWTYNKDFSIAAGLMRYDAKVEIPIPENAQHGDYHFMIRLTDRAGWQQLKAIAIIIEE